MVSRKTKVFAAGLVMAVGVGLAWPFRRTEPVEPLKPTATAPPVQVAAPASVAAGPISPPASVAASFAADTNTKQPNPLKGGVPKITPAPPVEPPAAAPVDIGPTETAGTSLATGPTEQVVEPVEAPTERMHVVHDGDSLERLAKRYLGDESRALEIFDLNRGTLENPHWLPIGVELRIPPRSRNEEI